MAPGDDDGSATKTNTNNNKKKKSEVEVLASSFEELGLSEETMGALEEMGISTPTEIQSIGIPCVLKGKSVVLGSHTGSGKTLAYMLPLAQVSFCKLTFLHSICSLLLGFPLRWC